MVESVVRVSRGKTHRGSRSLRLFLSSMQSRASPDHVAPASSWRKPGAHARLRPGQAAAARGSRESRRCARGRPPHATLCLPPRPALRGAEQRRSDPTPVRAGAQRDREAPDAGSRRATTVYLKTSKDNQYDVGARGEGATAPLTRPVSAPRRRRRFSGGSRPPHRDAPLERDPRPFGFLPEVAHERDPDRREAQRDAHAHPPVPHPGRRVEAGDHDRHVEEGHPPDEQEPGAGLVHPPRLQNPS